MKFNDSKTEPETEREKKQENEKEEPINEKTKLVTKTSRWNQIRLKRLVFAFLVKTSLIFYPLPPSLFPSSSSYLTDTQYPNWNWSLPRYDSPPLLSLSTTLSLSLILPLSCYYFQCRHSVGK